MASSFLRLLDHTRRRTTVDRTPLDEWSARRRDLYLTTHNTHTRQTSIPLERFEPTISKGELLQALDRAATGTDFWRHSAGGKRKKCVLWGWRYDMLVGSFTDLYCNQKRRCWYHCYLLRLTQEPPGAVLSLQFERACKRGYPAQELKANVSEGIKYQRHSRLRFPVRAPIYVSQSIKKKRFTLEQSLANSSDTFLNTVFERGISPMGNRGFGKPCGLVPLFKAWPIC